MLAQFMLILAGLALIWSGIRMPGDYSIRSNFVSESGGQGVDHAFLARTGLLALGAAAWAIAWAQDAVACLGGAPIAVFGVCLLVSALWSHRSWRSEAPFDPRSDAIHSAAARLAGISFTCAALVSVVTQQGGVLAWAALVMSICGPFAMYALPEFKGGIQRVMFAVSMLWLWSLQADELHQLCWI